MHITLANNVSIPQLGLGVWQMTNPEAEAAVSAALQAGYRHIDTAAIYRNEEGVGSAIRKSSVPREEIFVTTKLWNDAHDDPRAALDASLKRLGLTYVDLYLIHYPVPHVRTQSWHVLEALYREGKCRAIGVSNYTVRHLQELIEHADVLPMVNQVEMHPYLYQEELISFCMQHNIIIEAYSPLTHGKKLNDPKLIAIAQHYQKTPAQLLIRWCMQHGMVVLPKSSNPERIAQNADINFTISDEDMETMNAFHENLRTCWDPTNAP